MLRRLIKYLKKFALFFISAFALITAYLIYFFVSTDAPALKGYVQYHLPYNSEQTLDLYHPLAKVGDHSPVLLFIHGGAWISGSKLSVNNNRFNQVFNELRNQGYFIVSPDYTLAKNGQSPFPACITDTFEAVQWIRNHAEEYGWDLDRFGVMGESAGGHLALMASYAEPSVFGVDFDHLKPKFVIDVYGPTQMDSLYHASTTDSINALIQRLPASLAEQLDLARLLIGFDPKSYPKEAEELFNKYSPVNYIDSLAPPTLIVHGEADQVVPASQSKLLAQELDSVGVFRKEHYITGANHAFQGATDQQKVEMQDLVTIDSLHIQVTSAENDSVRVFFLSEISYQWSGINFDSAFKYAEICYQEALSSESDYNIGLGLTMMGIVYDYDYQFDSARNYYRAALNISKRIGHKKRVATSLFNIGVVFYYEGILDSALHYYASAEPVFQQINDQRNLSRLYNNLGRIYEKTGQSDFALEVSRKSLSIKEKLNDTKGILNTLTNISSIFQSRDEYDSALVYSQACLEKSKSIGDMVAYKAELVNLGIIYKNLEVPDKAFAAFKEAENLLIDSDDNYIKSEVYHNLGEYYYENEDWENTRIYLEKRRTVLLEEEYLEPAMQHYHLAFSYEKAIGNSQKALEYLERYIELREKFLSQLTLRQTTELEQLYEKEKREVEIQRLNAENQLQSLSIEKSSRERNALIAFVVLIIGLLILLCNLKLDIDTIIPLGLIINELITNAMKYAYDPSKKGSLDVSLKEVNDQLQLTIRDNGKGMDQQQMENVNSFGWKMIRSLSRKLKADISIDSENGTQDEPLVADDIAMILENHGYQVAGIADDSEDALQILQKQSPQLALLDINIEGDQDGIDLARNLNIPFIFLTSYYDQKTLDRAKRVNPSGYIVKPFSEKDLIANIEMALYRKKTPTSKEEKNPEKFFVRKDQEMISIQASEIVYVEAFDNYSTVYTENDKYLISHTLKSIEEKLVPMGFYRIHRSFLINFSLIDSISEGYVFLKGHKVQIGKSYKKDFLEKLAVL
ncbi:lytT [Symbiodinium microadriaticum]|nr:lytT [Symbiodinium microadriaticum]